MTINELAAQEMQQNLNMLLWHLGDLSDADMLARPTPTANHAMWQLGHLIKAEAGMISMITPGASALAEAFAGKFTKDSAKSNDPRQFPTKAEIIEQMNNTRANTIAWAKQLSEADLSKPAPEPIRSFCPLVANLLSLVVVHTAMHLGQVQVIRRVLGKPVLF